MMVAGLRLKPPGQCAETTEERSRPALTAETQGSVGCVTSPVCSGPPLFCWECSQCGPGQRERDMEDVFKAVLT